MIYAVIGPTASSKTSYSVNLAHKINAEIINVDAYSIYEHLDIVSAKVTIEEMEGVKHHFVSKYPLSTQVDVATFQKEVRTLISKLKNENKNIILVGGSNLYMQAVLFDYKFDVNVKYNYEKYEGYTYEEVVSILKKCDPKYIELAQKNKNRMIKAILYFENTNKKYSEKEKSNLDLFYQDVKFIYLNWDRNELYTRINKRVEIMFSSGLENEFLWLKNNYDISMHFYKTIGLREFIEYDDIEIVKDKIKQNSRRLAKRQISWIKNNIINNEQLNLTIVDF